MTQDREQAWRVEERVLGALAALAALVAFAYYFRNQYTLLYGDAVAHIHIARRLFDSRTPGPQQLGTVWLPLPHLLILPFVISDRSWQSGFGGSIPSLIAYVFGTIGVYRLVRRGLYWTRGEESSLPAWFAAAMYALNPNLLYLQSTAMTEPLYLALFVWATVYFLEFVHLLEQPQPAAAAGRALVRCGIALFGAMLTRYDGWFAAAVFALAALFATAFRNGQGSETAWSRLRHLPRGLGELRRPAKKFLLLLVATPAIWLAYNAFLFGNPLEFATGPYSARSIAERSTRAGDPHHPGYTSPRMAATYFVKSAELNMGEADFEKPWLWLAALGSILTLAFARRATWLLLLWVPLPFYALSIAWGGVPIFIPSWWPFSYYNVRYGLQLLPAIAVFTAMFLYIVIRYFQRLPSPKIGRAISILLVFGLLAFVGCSYASIWRQPIAFREAWVNSRTRIALETALAAQLERLPPSATLLMFTADHVGALQRAGIPLRRTINESNFRIWEAALRDPASQADYVIAFAGDAVSLVARQHAAQLTAVAVIETQGQPRATIYRTPRAPQ